MWIPWHSGIIGEEIADEQATIFINNYENPLIRKIYKKWLDDLDDSKKNNK